jgi:hypothetical protein
MKPEIKKFSLLQMHFDGSKCCFFVHGQQKEKISISEGKKNLIKISFSALFVFQCKKNVENSCRKSGMISALES